MTRALVLSGGAFLGALQVPVINKLMSEHKYDAIYGVSVGSLNGAIIASGDYKSLDKFWRSITSPTNFFLPSLNPLTGLLSTDRLKEKVSNGICLGNIKIPLFIGTTSFTDGEFRFLSTNDMKCDKYLHNSLMASACIAGIMKPVILEIDGSKHIACDGGFRNIIPNQLLDDYDFIDVVTCYQNESVLSDYSFFSVNIFKMILRMINIFRDEIYKQDFTAIKKSLKPGGVATIYAPSISTGSMLMANKSIIAKRIEEGHRMILNAKIL